MVEMGLGISECVYIFRVLVSTTASNYQALSPQMELCSELTEGRTSERRVYVFMSDLKLSICPLS